MRVISIRELHAKTGEWVRQARKHGEIQITDNGRTVAKIVPAEGLDVVPYFARRVPSPRFRRLSSEKRLSGGMDSTAAISEDREDREV